jgi:hypothetical protein
MSAQAGGDFRNCDGWAGARQNKSEEEQLVNSLTLDRRRFGKFLSLASAAGVAAMTG